MDKRVQRFLENKHSAIMVTLRKDGTPHVAKVAVGLVEGRLWSSGTQTRARTKHVRRDPRATLCVIDGDNPYSWLGIESRVTLREGDGAVGDNLALYRVLAGEPDDVEEYKRAMVEEQRLVYEFSIERTYGQY
ncbi:TIGR03618 family F420-dependent PPOX class oxidoreductase [soil metagenome]